MNDIATAHIKDRVFARTHVYDFTFAQVYGSNTGCRVIIYRKLRSPYRCHTGRRLKFCQYRFAGSYAGPQSPCLYFNVPDYLFLWCTGYISNVTLVCYLFDYLFLRDSHCCIFFYFQAGTIIEDKDCCCTGRGYNRIVAIDGRILHPVAYPGYGLPYPAVLYLDLSVK